MTRTRWRAVNRIVRGSAAIGNPIRVARATFIPAPAQSYAAFKRANPCRRGERSRNDLGFAVAVEIAGRDTEPTRVIGTEGKERQELPSGCIEDPDFRRASGAGADDDLCVPVAGHIAGSD